MKLKLLITALLFGLTTSAQINDTATLRNYINANIIPNSTRSITAAQLNYSLIGLLNVSRNYKVDTIYIKPAGDSLIYIVNSVRRAVKLAGSSSLQAATLIGDTTNIAIEITGTGFSTVKNRGLFLGYDRNNSRAQIYSYNHATGIYGNIILNASGGGFVGIGKTSPVEALDVNGNIVSNAPTYSSGGIDALGRNQTTGRYEKMSGSISHPIITTTGDITLDNSHYTVMCNNSAPVTVTLPTASSCTGRVYIIKKLSESGTPGFDVTISAIAGNTLDGLSEQIIVSQYVALTVQSNGTNWFILATMAPTGF